MKKILLLLAFAISIANVSKAQTFQMLGGYVTGDTVVNTGVKACSLKVVKNNIAITIGAQITKISGTVGGTVTLLGSLDGINFAAVDTNCILNGIATYTATNTAGVQIHDWLITGNPYLYYKLSYTGTGTMSASLLGYLLPRQSQ